MVSSLCVFNRIELVLLLIDSYTTGTVVSLVFKTLRLEVINIFSHYIRIIYSATMVLFISLLSFVYLVTRLKLSSFILDVKAAILFEF